MDTLGDENSNSNSKSKRNKMLRMPIGSIYYTSSIVRIIIVHQHFLKYWLSNTYHGKRIIRKDRKIIGTLD